VCACVSVVNLQVILTDCACVVFFQCVSMFPFFTFSYFLDVCYCSEYMLIMYLELLLLYAIACMRSLHLVRNILPVYPAYSSGRVSISLVDPLSSHLSVRGCCFAVLSCILRS
jgi:hypothetical protein